MSSLVRPLLPDSHPLLLNRVPQFPHDSGRAKEVRDILTHNIREYEALGLAANQIGMSDRAFAMLRNSGDIDVLFNPIVTELSADTSSFPEGCLSFPQLILDIKRPKTCRIVYEDLNGNRHTELLSGLEATIAQHEVDHLNGVVFTMRVSKLKLSMAIKKRNKASKHKA